MFSEKNITLETTEYHTLDIQFVSNTTKPHRIMQFVANENNVSSNRLKIFSDRISLDKIKV